MPKRTCYVSEEGKRKTDSSNDYFKNQSPSEYRYTESKEEIITFISNLYHSIEN